MSQAQLQTLLVQKKYRQAIDEIRKMQRSQPDLTIVPAESDVWLLRGQQELEKSEFKAAENSFRQALKLGLTDEVYYWLAKTLLAQNRLDAALDLIRGAFESKVLPKDEGICYLKLLLIKGDVDTVKNLIKTQAKRFSANQLHWAKGVLELQAGDPRSAIPHLSKLKKPLTPGDSIDAWMVYTLQQQGKSAEAATKLGVMGVPAFATFGQSKPINRPIIAKLAILQQAMDRRNPRRDILKREDRATQEIFAALETIKLMAEGNFHDAGHALLQINSPSTRTADLMALKSTILTMAGEQAMSQGETGYALKLWQPLMSDRELNPQLAVNFLHVLEEEGESQERQRLLTRLIKWIEQDAKRNPAVWPEARLKLVLAHAHCLMADSFISLSRSNAAWGSIQQGSRICPTSPEVIGRQGLFLIGEGKTGEGIDLLIQALDGGCQFDFVYETLIETLEEENRQGEIPEIRKRHGKNFGDVPDESEITIEPWIEALATRNYDRFSRSIPQKESPEPTLRACQIFRAAAYGKPTSTGKISIDQAQATAAWDSLVNGLTGIAKLHTLQAIALSIEVFSKRDKGIAALSTRYMLKICELKSELPEAQLAHLIVLAVKEKNPNKLELPLKLYLDKAPQPGNALASLQLQVRWFSLAFVLRSFIDTALSREPQNPLLLLAKATTFGTDSQPYDKFRSEGFELARRLQDAKALQAFRMEDRFLGTQTGRNFMPSLGNLGGEMPPEIEALFEEMIRKTIGKKISREQLDLLIPLLKRKFMMDMLNGNDDEDDDDDDFFSDFFGDLSDDDDDDDDDIDFFTSRSKKRKRSFMDL